MKKIANKLEKLEDDKSSPPTDDAIIQCVAAHFGVSFGTACDWIIEMAERMEVAA